MIKLVLSVLLLATCVVGVAQDITPVKVEELVTKYTSERGVVVVNFWSTWCKPCQEELPYFIKITDSLKSDGVSLMLVSLDSKTVFTNGKLKAFLKTKKWKNPTFWLNETDADHYCPPVDKDWSGVIPVTLILNNATGYRQFYEDALTREQLLEAILKAR